MQSNHNTVHIEYMFVNPETITYNCAFQGGSSVAVHPCMSVIVTMLLCLIVCSSPLLISGPRESFGS